MTYHGTVHNGVILVDGGATIPDGVVVRIEVVDKFEASTSPPHGPEPTIRGNPGTPSFLEGAENPGHSPLSPERR